MRKAPFTPKGNSYGAPPVTAVPEDDRREFLCLPELLREELADQWNDIVIYRGPLPAHSVIFTREQRFTSLFGIRSGWVKEVRRYDDGTEHVAGFNLQGDMLGLTGVAAGVYGATAVALDTVTLCEIPFDRLERAARERPELRKQLYVLIAEYLKWQQQRMRVLKTSASESRVAAFLVDLSGRCAQHGYSATKMRLPMTRGDIANYLGLTVETVSRVFSRFAADGTLRVANREIEIPEPQRLIELARPCLD